MQAEKAVKSPLRLLFLEVTDGVFSKYIYVTTKRGEERHTKKLTLTVHAEPYATLNPSHLSWRQEAPRDWKSAKFKIKRDKNIAIADIRADTKLFEVKKQIVTPGMEYKVSVKPRRMDQDILRAYIQLHVKYSSDKDPGVYRLHATIAPNITDRNRLPFVLRVLEREWVWWGVLILLLFGVTVSLIWFFIRQE